MVYDHCTSLYYIICDKLIFMTINLFMLWIIPLISAETISFFLLEDIKLGILRGHLHKQLDELDSSTSLKTKC